MVGVIPAYAQHLNHAAADDLLPDSPATSDSVYFDMCGIWMVSYRESVAKWLYFTFLPVLLLAPPPGVQRAGMVKAAGVCVLSLLGSLALPAAVGGLRAFLSGVRLCILYLCATSVAQVTRHALILRNACCDIRAFHDGGSKMHSAWFPLHPKHFLPSRNYALRSICCA